MQKYDNVYFFNGTAYAGKSTMVKRLADPDISMSRFFDRPDREKQFLYQLLLAEVDPEKAIANFRECLARVNSQENYDMFLHSGFRVLLRDESRSIEETMKMVEEVLGFIPLG